MGGGGEAEGASESWRERKKGVGGQRCSALVFGHLPGDTRRGDVQLSYRKKHIIEAYLMQRDAACSRKNIKTLWAQRVIKAVRRPPRDLGVAWHFKKRPCNNVEIIIWRVVNKGCHMLSSRLIESNELSRKFGRLCSVKWRETKLFRDAVQKCYYIQYKNVACTFKYFKGESESLL